MYVFTETINILIIAEHAIFLYFIHINQENTENFILGPKPPGPNRERAETSWGRTGKGPKPLAFFQTTALFSQSKSGLWLAKTFCLSGVNNCV